jgi:hypothetical protein
MKMTAHNFDADGMFVHAAANQCAIEVDAIIKKYAAIVPERLRDSFESKIASANLNAWGCKMSESHLVPVLFGDDAYNKAAQMMAAGIEPENIDL